MKPALIAALLLVPFLTGCAAPDSGPSPVGLPRLGASSVTIVNPTWKVNPDGLDFNAWYVNTLARADLDFVLDVEAPPGSDIRAVLAGLSITYEGATTPVALDATWGGGGTPVAGPDLTLDGRSQLGARIQWRNPAEDLRAADPSLFSALTPNFAGRLPTFEVLQRHVQLVLHGNVRVTQPNGSATPATEFFNLSFSLLVPRPVTQLGIHEGQVFPTPSVPLSANHVPTSGPPTPALGAIAWGDATTSDVLATRADETITLAKGPHEIETLSWNGFSFDLRSTHICVEQC